MSKKYIGSFADGFFGSFKLAAMVVAALIAVISGFVNSEPIDNSPVSKLPH